MEDFSVGNEIKRRDLCSLVASKIMITETNGGGAEERIRESEKVEEDLCRKLVQWNLPNTPKDKRTKLCLFFYFIIFFPLYTQKKYVTATMRSLSDQNKMIKGY